MDKRIFLKSIKTFSFLSDKTVNELAKILEEKKYSAGETIFCENDKADGIYIIVNGSVIISKKTSPETEKILAVLGEKSIFGETALFVDFPRTAYVRAKTDTVCFKINRSNYEKIMESDSIGARKTMQEFLLYTLQRLEQTNLELATIYEISKILTTIANIDEFYLKILKQICYSINSIDSIILFLWNEFIQEYEIKSTVNVNVILQEKLDKNNKLIKFISDCSETRIIKNNIIDEFLYKNLYNFNGSKTNYIITPLWKNAELIGFIVLFNQSKEIIYGSNINDLMNSIGNLLISAIENIINLQENKARERLNKSRIFW